LQYFSTKSIAILIAIIAILQY